MIILFADLYIKQPTYLKIDFNKQKILEMFVIYRIFYPPKSLWVYITLSRELEVIKKSFKALDDYIKSVPFIQKRVGLYLSKYTYRIELLVPIYMASA